VKEPAALKCIIYNHDINFAGELNTEPRESKKIGVEATKAAMLSVHGDRRNGLTQLSNGLIHHYRIRQMKRYC
jgi:hypothetical protein